MPPTVVIQDIISRGITPWGETDLAQGDPDQSKGAIATLEFVAIGLTVRQRRLHQGPRHVRSLTHWSAAGDGVAGRAAHADDRKINGAAAHRGQLHRALLRYTGGTCHRCRK